MEVGCFREISYAELCRQRKVDSTCWEMWFFPTCGMLLEGLEEVYARRYQEQGSHCLYLQDASHGPQPLDALQKFSEESQILLDYKGGIWYNIINFSRQSQTRRAGEGAL